MMKIIHLLSAAMILSGMVASAQTRISFESEDYSGIGVYDQWTESPFRTGILTGNAGIADNPDKSVDISLGISPNPTDKVVAFQRSKYAGNAYGVRIDLKEPIRVTKQLQYIHVMTYLKDKPVDSRMMVIGLGKRLESNWEWQTGEEEQFWALTNEYIKAKDQWQDIVVSFKGFSYSKEENPECGVDIYSLVIIPDLRSPHDDKEDWIAYFDEIIVDNNPEKRFSTDKYVVDFIKEATPPRTDRCFAGVGLDSDGEIQSFSGIQKQAYNDCVSKNVFSARPGQTLIPVFNYMGAWMNAYVYVDWGCDGIFSSDVNKDGMPSAESDLVSYNAMEFDGIWRRSDGTVAKDGNNIAEGVPSFTIPPHIEPGFYRMRYKVDWCSLDPAGSKTIVPDGGGVVDATLDIHSEYVNVNASQLNGDIVLAEDQRPLQNYRTPYGMPLKVKVIPEKGFVQNGFILKYGYNVNATEQLDENGNPNWIEVKIPHTEISPVDGTYTIPAEYIRGSSISIIGDMRQAQPFAIIK